MVIGSDAGHGQTAPQIAQHLLELPGEGRLELLRALLVRVLPRLEGVRPADFLERLTAAPRAAARTGFQAGDAQRAESRDEVFEDVLEQPLGAQRQILELAAPRVVGELDDARRDRYLRELRAAVERAEQGQDAERTETRH